MKHNNGSLYHIAPYNIYYASLEVQTLLPVILNHWTAFKKKTKENIEIDMSLSLWLSALASVMVDDFLYAPLVSDFSIGFKL